jgi:hypothetical protein
LISLALMIGLLLVVGVRQLIRGAGGVWVPAGDVFLLFYVVAYPSGLVANGLLIAAVTKRPPEATLPRCALYGAVGIRSSAPRLRFLRHLAEQASTASSGRRPD